MEVAVKLLIWDRSLCEVFEISFGNLNERLGLVLATYERLGASIGAGGCVTLDISYCESSMLQRISSCLREKWLFDNGSY